MIEKILNKVLNELTLVEENPNNPNKSALRVRLSKDAADYFLTSLFNPNIKTQLDKSLKDAYAQYLAEADRKKLGGDSKKTEDDFIEAASRKCLEIISPYMQTYNQSITRRADDFMIGLAIGSLKNQHPKRGYVHICNKKSLALFCAIIVAIVLVCEFAVKNVATAAFLGVILGLICSFCFFLVGVFKKDERWSAALLKKDVFKNMRNQLGGQDYAAIDQWPQSVVNLSGANPTVEEAMHDFANIPGIAHLFATTDFILVQDILALTASYVYPPELFDYFVFWYNAQNFDHPITLSDWSEQGDKDGKQEELQLATTTQGNTTTAPITSTLTSGFSLDITESGDNKNETTIDIGVSSDDK